MRMILFFDLPVEKEKQKKAYRRFVKLIKSEGFYLIQKSVYVKMGIDIQALNSSINKIKKELPTEGNIFVISITEKQFANIVFLVGDHSSDVISSDSRYIEL